MALKCGASRHKGVPPRDPGSRFGCKSQETWPRAVPEGQRAGLELGVGRCRCRKLGKWLVGEEGRKRGLLRREQC